MLSIVVDQENAFLSLPWLDPCTPKYSARWRVSSSIAVLRSSRTIMDKSETTKSTETMMSGYTRVYTSAKEKKIVPVRSDQIRRALSLRRGRTHTITYTPLDFYVHTFLVHPSRGCVHACLHTATGSSRYWIPIDISRSKNPPVIIPPRLTTTPGTYIHSRHFVSHSYDRSFGSQPKEKKKGRRGTNLAEIRNITLALLSSLEIPNSTDHPPPVDHRSSRLFFLYGENKKSEGQFINDELIFLWILHAYIHTNLHKFLSHFSIYIFLYTFLL